MLRLAGIAERALTGAARRLASGRTLVEPAEWRRPGRVARPADVVAGSDGAPIVLLTAVAWDYRFQRPQQLATAFALRGQPVLYVEAFSRARIQPRFFARRQPQGPLVLELGLPGRPDPYRTVLDPAAAQAIATTTARGLKRAPAFVLAELPFWLHLALALRRELDVPLVYDRLDLHSGFEGVPAQTLEAERQLIGEADLVVASSSALAPDGGPRTMLLHNAVAIDDFPAAEAPAGATPKVGYVGALSSWIDARALRTAAQALPEWSFELAGRVESTAVADLRQVPNIRLLGEIPYAEVPRFLAGLHALLIPFVDSPLTRAVDPVKLYEAMAVGLPIVARALPEIGRWPTSLVHTYQAEGDLPRVLTAAVEGDHPRLRAARRAAVSEETWQNRAAQLARAMRSSRG